MSNKPLSIESNAGATDGYYQYPFAITQKLVYLTNDSADYDMQVNFDGGIGENGTFTIKAGEIITEIPMSCTTVSLQGVGGSVAFRIMGV